jgi:class 3 adenylate cyclase/tetratricopeptide (TPR) repeat protein
MRCPACSADNAEGNSFCQSCGTALKAVCLQCRQTNAPNARFCGACGATLRAPDGERKFATVMFADIVGSTQLIAGLDPEEALERLKPAVALMCATVQRFDGTVVRALGDGIMALFGAPRAQEGHALIACQAALAMLAELPREEGAPNIRIGLHSGELVASVLASDPTREQGAHGLTVHLASRLQGIAEPGTVCLSDDCYHLVRLHCEARALGTSALKGFPEEIETYRLLGLKPAVTSRPFSGTIQTSFRGRDHELNALRGALSRTETGDTQVVGISGVPGSGKSRLCYEFAEWCRGRLIPILEVRAQIYGHATPLQPVLEFLRLWFGIALADDAAVARQRISGRLLAISQTFEADLTLLYEFLGIADSAMPPSRLQARARHARLIDIVRHIVRHGGNSLSVILVEDLHWLDEPSEDFVSTLVEAAANTRTLLLLNYRPPYAAPWMNLPQFQELPLTELSPAQTDALVEELIGGDANLADVRRRVAKRSGGNPFFAEELARSLSHKGVLLQTFLGDTLPATVEAVIGDRIDRLGDGEKAVLQIGAIIGKEFPLVVLEEVVGPLASTIDAVLLRLRDNGLVQELTSNDGRRFSFRHPLIQEVCYATQLKSRRRTLHAAVACAMERYYSDRQGEFAALIAHHYDAARHFAAAARHESRAAAWVGSTHSGQAIKHWQKVRALLQNPDCSGNESLQITANSQIAWLGWREGMAADTAKSFVEEALGWARQTDDSMIPMLLFVDGRITVATGGPADTYVARVREALSPLDAQRDAGRIATLNCALSQAYGWAGLLNDALAANTAALLEVARVDKFDHQFLGYSVEHWVMSLRARILLRLGRFDEAREILMALIAIEQTLVDPTVQFGPHFGLVDLAWCLGDPRLAKHHAACVAEIAERHGSAYLRVFALAAAGIAKSVEQDFIGAIADFREGLNIARTTKAAMEYECEMLASIADCQFQASAFEPALRSAREAIAIAQQRSSRLPECRASITCGAALLALEGDGQLSQAEALFNRANELIALSGATIYRPMLAKEQERVLRSALKRRA